MSEILKNTASQSVFVTVIDSATGGGKTSGVSFTYTAAGGSQAALTNAPTHKGNGQYEVVPTQAETNVDCFSIGWYGSGVVPNCVTIYTTTKRLRDLQDLAAGAAMTLTAAYDKAKDDVLTPLAVIDALVDTLIDRLTATRAEYLDAAISSRSSHNAAAVVAAMEAVGTKLTTIHGKLPDGGIAKTGEYDEGLATILENVLGGNATLAGVVLLASAMSKLQQADIKLNTTTTPWTEEYYEKGTATLLMTKVLYDKDGTGITSIDSYIGRRMNA